MAKHINQILKPVLTAIKEPTRNLEIKTSSEWRDKWIGLDESHPETKIMAIEAEIFSKRCFLNDRSGPTLLVVCGDNGCGKTHTARAIFNYQRATAITSWEKGYWGGSRIPDAVFLKWSEVADEGEYDGVWLDAINASLCIIDDVGSEVDQYRSGKTTENLRRMLGEREGRFTVVTTNIPPSQWMGVWDSRVEDRLYRKSKIIELPNAPSYYRPS